MAWIVKAPGGTLDRAQPRKDAGGQSPSAFVARFPPETAEVVETVERILGIDRCRLRIDGERGRPLRMEAVDVSEDLVARPKVPVDEFHTKSSQLAVDPCQVDLIHRRPDSR